eukprot:Opistho-2@62061
MMSVSVMMCIMAAMYPHMHTHTRTHTRISGLFRIGHTARYEGRHRRKHFVVDLVSKTAFVELNIADSVPFECRLRLFCIVESDHVIFSAVAHEYRCVFVRRIEPLGELVGQRKITADGQDAAKLARIIQPHI